MRSLRRAAVAAVCFTLGAAVVASPGTALAEPANGARPDIVNSASDAAPGQLVGKDAEGRTIVYVEGAREQELLDAVTKAGGVVADTDEGRVKAAVPADKLDQVASQPGVTEVRLPDRAVPMSITSAGVGLSKADQWIAAGNKGAGVKVGVIDIGFGRLAEAQGKGELPTGDQLVVNNSNCIDGTVKKPHGTAVAEIIHDMAPDAQLYLACIEDTVSFSAAEQWLRGQGVQIISAAVGFLSPSGGRGDGTGPTDSPADVVKRSREAGVLWSVAAGNQGLLHFGGKAVDANSDKWVEYAGTTQNKGFPVKHTATATVGIRWDAWPKTTEDLDLYVMNAGNSPPTGDDDPRIVAKSTRSQKDTAGGTSPNEEVSFTNSADPAITRTYWVYIKNNNAKFTTPFDLFVGGDVDGQLQSPTSERSVTEPGTSPYVMTVGATAANSGVLETNSGRGPTIDGRQKPDITGFDKVATSVVPTFLGTSAAAAHVAGAAAVLKSANPQLDAAQLQAALQAKASPKKSDNAWGNGTLHLGTPDTVPTFTGSGFTVLQEQPRIHTRSYAPGETFTLPSFETVPGDTTAVALTVSGRSDVDTTLDIFPAGAAESSRGTSLKVRGGELFTSLTAFVPLGTARAIKIRNRAGTTGVVVEFLGYFSPGDSTDLYNPLGAPVRVLDTRGFVGSPRNTPLKSGDVQDIPIRGAAGVPAGATSVVVNLTGFEATAETFLGLYGDNRTGITTVSVAQAQRRSNLAVVPIGSDGKIRLYAGGGQSGAAVDVVGWFAEGTGSRYVTLPEAARLADTATGTGLPKEPIGQGQSATVQVKGMAGVSSSALAAALTVTGTEDQFGTELSVSTTERGWSPVTNIGSRQREPMAGMVLSPMGVSGKVDVRNERGRAQVSVDVSGYFIGAPPFRTPEVSNCVTAKDDAGFTSVFDGRHESGIEGWLPAGTTRAKVEGCELATETGDDVTWYGARSYANDYTLKLDWLSTTDNSDSGVLVGFPNPSGDKSAPGNKGMEINIGPRSASGTLKTGGFVGFQAPSTTAPVKPNGQWNTFEITVRFNMVTVVLNGTKVNEYTMTDQSRVHLNSYIGLQNHNVGDQVRFRNIRMKRDTPVRSGTFVAAGKCLDVWGGDVYQSIVVMHECHGAFNQTWTTSGDGGILAGGRCLAAEGGRTDNGTPVVLKPCDGNDSEQWILRQDGRIVNPPSRRCITPVPPEPNLLLRLQDCATDRSEQVFQTPDQRGRSGKLVGPGGNCLDVPDNDPRTGNVGLWTCNASVAQLWAMTGDGTLRGDGKCLDVKESGTANGHPVDLWECNGTQAQQWVGQPDGTLVNPSSGRCLTSTTEAGGATLTINDCTVPSRQTWRLSAETVMRGALVGYGSKCLDVVGNDPNTTSLWYFTCFGPGGQLFWNLGDGAFRAYGKCLDIGSVDNRTPVRLAACGGHTSQQWVSRHDGTLVNILANRCLDVTNGNTADGTTIQIHDCTGSAAQRWSIPVKSS